MATRSRQPIDPPAPADASEDTHTAGISQPYSENTQTVHLTPEDERRIKHAGILSRLGSGASYREIAVEFSVGLATISAIARKQAALETGAIAKLMQSKALQALEHWETAMEAGAKQGKHAAARDWLTHSKALEPVQSEAGNGAKVAIVIGMPGQPIDGLSLQVIESKGHSATDTE